MSHQADLLRDSDELTSLDWRWLFDAARGGGAETLRIWVPGCGQGEEAYTVAIIASEALGPYSGAVDILATDSSPANLELATEGSYEAHQLDEVPLSLRARYFESQVDRFVIRIAITERVRFRQHNIMAEDLPPEGEGGFDVISCRHVLDGAPSSTVDEVIRRLELALRPGGVLVIGQPDRPGGSQTGEPGKATPAGERRRQPHRPRERGLYLRSPLGLPGGPRNSRKPPPPIDSTEGPRTRIDDRIENAVLAIDAEDYEAALQILTPVLQAHPLHGDGHFLSGVALLGSDDPNAAVRSFERAIYIDPSFSLALFELARAHETRGDYHGARQAYERALRTLEAPRDRHRVVLDYVDVNEVRSVCAGRLRSLSRAA